jgi:hypothetical protein
VPLALEFNDTFDLTAVGTCALALVTLVSLILGWRALRQTKQEIQLSRREVEEARRPVILPLADDREITLVGRDVPDKIAARPRAATQLLLVPIENIGTGPALQVQATLRLRNEGGEPTALGMETQSNLGGLRTDGRVPLRFKIQGLTGQTPGFSLSLKYLDVAGRTGRTDAVYAPSRDSYEIHAPYREDVEAGAKGWFGCIRGPWSRSGSASPA